MKKLFHPLIIFGAVLMLSSCGQSEPANEEKTQERVRVAVLLTEGFHDGEAYMPIGYLTNKGVLITVIGPEANEVKACNSDFTISIDKAINEVSINDFDALILPGGEAPWKLREDENVVAFAMEFFNAGKPTATICYGLQVLITADVLKGLTCTGLGKIQEEIEEAGATYVDESVVIDNNLITSRVPTDLSDFCAAIEKVLSEKGFFQK